MKVESLVCSQWLAAMSRGEHLSAAEAICEMALSPMYHRQAISREVELDASRVVGATAVARTGGIFALDPGDGQALNHYADSPLEELPPLPYPRCWFEVWDDESERPCVIQDFVDADGREEQLVAYGLLEVEPAARWDVFAMFNGVGVDRMSVRAWQLRALAHVDLNDPRIRTHGTIGGKPDRTPGPIAVVPDGGVGDEFDHVPEEHAALLNSVLMAPLWFAQLITTLGVRLPSVPLPRAEKRRIERRFGPGHPSIYRVDLRGAGDQHPGRGDQQFFHRWLVRGHYREHEHGRYVVPGKGACSWVRPYVKGPAGAPWKGRPVYTTSETG